MPGLATLARLLPSVRARPYGSGGAVCARFARGLPFLSRHLSSVRAPGDAMSVPSLLFLSQRLRSVHAFGLAVLAGVVLGSRAALRFYCGVLPRFTPAVCRLAPNRTACGILRSCSAGSRSPFVRSRGVGAVICLCGFTSDLAVSLWRSRRGYRGCGETGTGVTRERGWRRGLCASLRGHIGLAGLSAGSTLGLRAPACAKESSTLWTLLTLRRGYVGAYTRRHPGTRKDLTGSDLWPVRSGCMSIISTRTIGDLPDSDLWSGRSCIIARQQVSAGTARRVCDFLLFCLL